MLSIEALQHFQQRPVQRTHTPWSQCLQTSFAWSLCDKGWGFSQGCRDKLLTQNSKKEPSDLCKWGDTSNFLTDLQWLLSDPLDKNLQHGLLGVSSAGLFARKPYPFWAPKEQPPQVWRLHLQSWSSTWERPLSELLLWWPEQHTGNSAKCSAQAQAQLNMQFYDVWYCVAGARSYCISVSWTRVHL